MHVLLISTYELGHQPFGLASPAAWLRARGAVVTCLDLAVQPLEPAVVAAADLIAFYLPMHTATRIAARIVNGVREINPTAHLCFYGLYAPANEAFLRKLGGGTILGGEFEEGLVSLVDRLGADRTSSGRERQAESIVSLERQQFRIPDRAGLPQLDRYAHLILNDEQRTVGYTEATRGCKHLCRHCPIVPVYQGSFRVVQRNVVLADIRRQVEAGAQHITFGDPDFFNGPTHGIAIARTLHKEFPELTYDVTIKIEHLLKHADLLGSLVETGCILVTSAVESIDPVILEMFDKRHAPEDLLRVVTLFREVGLTLNPTFVTFTPWTTVGGYVDLLRALLDLDLVDSVASIQYAIRLLIPKGSSLLELPSTRDVVQAFDEQVLCYPWTHPDPSVDILYEDVRSAVLEGQRQGESRRGIFRRVWSLAHEAHQAAVTDRLAVARLDQAAPRSSIPYLSEPWYC
jgi:radical SAM superfamily enzyme YgiQ (UPF0313 family)